MCACSNPSNSFLFFNSLGKFHILFYLNTLCNFFFSLNDCINNPRLINLSCQLNELLSNLSRQYDEIFLSVSLKPSREPGHSYTLYLKFQRYSLFF